MSDTQPVQQPDPPDPPEPAQAEPPPPPPTPPPPPPTVVERARLRDQLFGLRSLLAVGVAGVIVGGLAGFGISAATAGDDRDGRMGRFAPGPGGFPNGPGRGFQGPGQGPAQVPGGGQLPQPPQGAPTQAPPTQAPSQDS